MDDYQSIKISALAEEDRPREKLLLKGRSTLSDAELIAILIGSGTKSLSAVDLSKYILASVNYDLGSLARMSVKDLQQFKGIGEAKAVTIVSALELGRRRKNEVPQKRQKISSSKEAYDLMKPDLMDEPIESFYIILLNRSNQLIKKQLISKGGTHGTIADPKIIFKHARLNVCGM
jgi:DNA repair protein RadC